MSILNNDLEKLAQYFEINIATMNGKLACVFTGEWSHGKSTLINSLLGMPILPTDPIPTNKTIVKLERSNEVEPHIKITSANGEITEQYGHQAVELLQTARLQHTGIEYQAPNLNIPEHVQFVDTPGFNDTDQIASTQAETVAADVVVFVLNPLVAAVNQAQLAFIQQVVISKADIKDIFFVFTHSDSLDEDPSKKSEEMDVLGKRLGSYIPAERIYFVSSTRRDGIEELVNVLYNHLKSRLPTLLQDRNKKYQLQVLSELESRIRYEKLALQQFKDQSADKRQELLSRIQEAQKKENSKKNEIRQRSKNYLSQTIQDIRNMISHQEDVLEAFIEETQVSQLQQPGFLQTKIQNIIEEKIHPFVKDKIDHLLSSIQGDITTGESYSSALLEEMDIKIPGYQSPLNRVTAEQLMPIAVIGSIMMFGWMAPTTLVMGYITMKAKTLGLIKNFDQLGLLDVALNKIKQVAASGYKQAVKVSLAQTFNDYTQQLTSYCQDVIQHSTEKALDQVNYVDELEKALRKLRDEGGKSIINREIMLDKAETMIMANKTGSFDIRI